jgi:hypothetical protein
MKSKVYRDLTPKKLNEVTVDDIDSLRAAMFAQGRKNTKAYDDMQQVAIASNQQGGSGSIPKTSTIVAATNIYDNKSTLFGADVGVWLLEAIEFQVTGGAGQYTHDVIFVHKNGAEMIVFHDIKDAADIVAIRSEIEIDQNIDVQVLTTGGGGIPTDVTAYAYLMRRR